MPPPVGVTDPVSVAARDFQYHSLNPELAEQLVSIYRTMFPHDALPGEFYEYVIRKIDDKSAQDADLLHLITDGVESLNDPAEWNTLSAEARLQALEGRAKTPFFQALRSDFVVHFYSNPAIWAHFGYEGPSNDQGGYLTRGFNDIDWIKNEEL